MDIKPGTTTDLGPGLSCSLGPDARANRKLEWVDLAALALSTDRLQHGVVSTFRIELADQIEDLVAKETDCCGSWLDAAIDRADGLLRLELTSSKPEGRAAIHRLSGLANE